MKELFNSLSEGVVLVGVIIVIVGVSAACWITMILGLMIWALTQDTSWIRPY